MLWPALSVQLRVLKMMHILIIRLFLALLCVKLSMRQFIKFCVDPKFRSSVGRISF